MRQPNSFFSFALFSAPPPFPMYPYAVVPRAAMHRKKNTPLCAALFFPCGRFAGGEARVWLSLQSKKKGTNKLETANPGGRCVVGASHKKKSRDTSWTWAGIFIDTAKGRTE